MTKLSATPVLTLEQLLLGNEIALEINTIAATEAGQTFPGSDDHFDFVSYAGWTAGTYLRATLDPTRNSSDSGWAQGATYNSIEGLIGILNGTNRLTGNDGGNKLIGGNLDDTLVGGLGADTLVGGKGIDRASYEYAAEGVTVYLGGNGTNTGEAEGDVFEGIEALVGSEHADTLVGDNNANTLEGGGGDDLFIGGLGADSIVGGEGNDTISYADATSGFALGIGGMGLNFYGLEKLVGSALGDRVSLVENVIGSNFNDWILGGNGNNRLDGGKGNDFFDGHGGADVFIGGEGVDTVSYKFDTVGLTIVLGEGEDDGTAAQVFGDVPETDTLSGIENVTGSIAADQITGNSVANVINGHLGADVMTGKDGNDIYYVDNAGDQTIEDNVDATTGGIDMVYSSVTHALAANVEHLYATGSGSIRLYGNSLSNMIVGNSGANAISGGDGNDTINGGAGRDALTGGNGYDIFVFNSKPSSSSNYDKIADFNYRQDMIHLENKVFTKLKAGKLASSAFYASKTAVKGHDSNDRIVYNTKTGYLYYDADGSGKGAAVHFATLKAGTKIGYADFFVI